MNLNRPDLLISDAVNGGEQTGHHGGVKSGHLS